MKVYVLTSGCYSSYCIEAVKLNRAEAEALVRVHPDWNIEEYDTDDIQVPDKAWYYVRICDDGGVLVEGWWETEMEILRLTGCYLIRGICAKDANHAVKIALDALAEYKYRKRIEEETVV